MRWIALALTFFCSAEFAMARQATLVLVSKGERRMQIMNGDAVVGTYSIALGGSPVGHKEKEGDERTPEGSYVLDWRNSKSGYHRSIHVSYPNETDIERAAKSAKIRAA